ncbi:MAG: hypothetical protein JO207_01405 [Verrucomicrobia bacterium]|nr:hypothetical protein [Verrucomicrobiota bacterium]
MNREEKHGRFTALLYVVTSTILLVVSSICIHLSPGTPPSAPIVHWLGAGLIGVAVAWILALGYLVTLSMQ